MFIMEIVGWASLGLLGFIGLFFSSLILIKRAIIEFKNFKFKIKKAIEVSREDIEEKTKSKKERLAKLRSFKDEEKDIDLANKLEKISIRINNKNKEEDTDANKDK